MAEQRQPEIDSLRGLAVLLVLFDHFGISRAYGFPWGIVGVKLLFIFSGYFITRQILKELHGGTGPFDLAGFYRKRVLRLVPVLYGAVLIGLIFNIDGARQFWPWHLGFATNYLVMGTGEWPGAFSHFWSLGLQMQFYLIWPMLMVWMPARLRGWTIGGCFILAFAFRSLMIGTGSNDFMRWLHLPGTLDAFAVGALVAWIEKERPRWSSRLREWRYACVPLAFASLWAAIRLRGVWPPGPAHALMETFECAFLAWFFFSLRLRVNPFAPLLRVPGLPAVGAVSFGLYAFHPLVENASSRWLFPQMGALASVPGVREVLLVVLSLGTAALCHITLERKIGDLVHAGVQAVIGRVTSWANAAYESVAGSRSVFSLLGMGRLSGAISAVVVLGVLGGPVLRFHVAPIPYASLMTESAESVDLAIEGNASASPGEQVASEFIEPLPEFDWGYLPFGEMYDQSPAVEIEVTDLDEIQASDEA